MSERDALVERLSNNENAMKKAEEAKIEHAKEAERQRTALEVALAEERSRRDKLESYWHSYYQGEMEKILVEKVDLLQKQVQHLEEDLQAERKAELTQLNLEHDQVMKK